MEAAENNHLDAVKYLIKAGALVDPKVRAPLRAQQGRLPAERLGSRSLGLPPGPCACSTQSSCQGCVQGGELPSTCCSEQGRERKGSKLGRKMQNNAAETWSRL